MLSAPGEKCCTRDSSAQHTAMSGRMPMQMYFDRNFPLLCKRSRRVYFRSIQPTLVFLSLCKENIKSLVGANAVSLCAELILSRCVRDARTLILREKRLDF
jgi:hypothetical protein